MRISRKMAIYAGANKGFVLYDGTENPIVDNTGGASNWENYDGVYIQPAVYTTTPGSGRISFETGENRSGGGYKRHKTAIDVTNYTKCTVVYKSLSPSNPCSVGFVRNATVGSSVSWLTKHDNNSSDSEQTAVLNLDSITGNVYFLFSIYGHTSGYKKMEIRKIVFE